MKNVLKLIALILLIQSFYTLPNVFGKDKSNEIYFISDTQEPIFFEKLLSKYENNEEGTRTLFGDIERYPPKALFMLGDLVGFGFNDFEWVPIEKLLGKLKRMNIPVYAIPGNHEYIFNEYGGIQEFKKHFPYNSTEGFIRTIDSIAVIMLNSNFGNLKDRQIKKELRWYNRTIDSVQNIKSIKAIIVCCHHPPFTNSEIVNSSIDVQKNILPSFFRNSKARLFLSGHSHNLEHHIHNGKDFIVLGGGGGIRQKLRKSENCLPGTVEINNKPRFFYLKVKMEGSQIIVTARGISGDFTKFTEIEVARFSLE